MRTLVADDSPVFRNTILALLASWGYEPIAACDGRNAWEALSATNGPRLAILDWMMPGMDGAEVCRRVRAATGERYVYILLLTSRSDSADLVAGMDAGADDYLTKPFNMHELRVRLRAGRRILELQEELEAVREALRHKATHDGLTGLYNRAAILEILEKEMARSRRDNLPLAVTMADVDHFKQVNDEMGHAAGDQLLAEAAGRMSAVLRAYDALGRYGGEEFLAVLPGCDSVESVKLAERLRAALAGKPFHRAGATRHMTLSLGVSWTAAPKWLDSDALLQAADAALYRAKRQGRNRVEVAAPRS
jgi:diguanylate cyclase (GGDEF)-like protein